MKVLCVAPHGDDEALGCGGTLARHAAQGDAITILYLTGEDGSVREQESRAVCAALPATPIFWHEPDGGLVVHEHLTTRLRDLTTERQYDIVYAPNAHERHSDHVAAHALVWYAVRTLRAPHPVLSLYEVWAPLRKVKRVVDITPYRDAKRRMIVTYWSQFGGERFPNFMEDAIFGLNRYRAIVDGHQEFELAEAFG